MIEKHKEGNDDHPPAERSHAVTARMEPGRPGRARKTDAASLCGIAPDGPWLYGRPEPRPHAANHSSHPRSLSTPGQSIGKTMGEPLPLLRGRGPGDATHTGGFRALETGQETWRGGAAGVARRGVNRFTRAGSRACGAG